MIRAQALWRLFGDRPVVLIGGVGRERTRPAGFEFRRHLDSRSLRAARATGAPAEQAGLLKTIRCRRCIQETQHCLPFVSAVKNSPVNGTSASVGPVTRRTADWAKGSRSRHVGMCHDCKAPLKPPLGEQSFTVGAALPRVGLVGGGSRRPSKRVDVDRDLYGVMRSHEFAPVGRWAASGRDGRPQGCAGTHPQRQRPSVREWLGRVGVKTLFGSP